MFIEIDDCCCPLIKRERKETDRATEGQRQRGEGEIETDAQRQTERV